MTLHLRPRLLKGKSVKQSKRILRHNLALAVRLRRRRIGGSMSIRLPRWRAGLELGMRVSGDGPLRCEMTMVLGVVLLLSSSLGHLACMGRLRQSRWRIIWLLFPMRVRLLLRNP